MSYLSVYRSRRSVRAALGLVLLAAGLPACRSEAQSNATGAAATSGASQVPAYRLTEPMVRKVSTVLREWDPTPDLEAMLALTDVGIGMPKEKFEALPADSQALILIESRNRATKKFREGEKQLQSLTVGSLSDRTRSAERIPALKTALGRAGYSTREFVQAFNAYYEAMGHVLREEFGPQPPPPPGIPQDNVNLFRTMSKAEQLWTSLGLTTPKG
jgi:hypothetical protein